MIREVNEAIATGDPRAAAVRIHPDVVWEHNIGAGTPEEGVYRGRESVLQLFERVVETWEYIRPEPDSIDSIEAGRYRVTGDLRCKHRTSETEIVASVRAAPGGSGPAARQGRDEVGGDCFPVSKLLDLQNRFYDRLRSRAAYGAADHSTTGRFDHVKGHKYGLIVTFKHNGDAVPTPVWFGLDDEGRLYFRTGPDVAKVRRIRNNPRVLVAPCTVRGKPLGPSVEGTARELPEAEREHAEAAIQSNYGLGRRLYEGTADAMVDDVAYVEVVPSSE